MAVYGNDWMMADAVYSYPRLRPRSRWELLLIRRSSGEWWVLGLLLKPRKLRSWLVLCAFYYRCCYSCRLA